MTRFLNACIAVALICAAPAWCDDLVTISGKGNVNGTLEKITDADIVLKAGAKSVPTPVAQVLDLRLREANKAPMAASYFEGHLADESVLRCSKLTLGAKEAQLTLTTGILVKAPMPAILTVLRDAQDDKVRTQFDKLKRNKKRID